MRPILTGSWAWARGARINKQKAKLRQRQRNFLIEVTLKGKIHEKASLSLVKAIQLIEG
jgi:hypothetical protein